MKNQGMTLIEMLVVIAVLGIIITAVLTNFARARTNASNAAALSCAQQLRGAQATAQTREGEFTVLSQLSAPACDFAGSRLPRTETPSNYTYAVRHPRGDRTYIATDSDLRWTRASAADALTLAEAQTTPLGHVDSASGGAPAGGGSAPAPVPAVPSMPTSDNIANVADGQSILRLHMHTEGAYRLGLPQSTFTVTGPEPGRSKIQDLLERMAAQKPTDGNMLSLNVNALVPSGTYSVTTERHLQNDFYNNFPETFVKVGEYPGRWGNHDTGYDIYTRASGSDNPYTGSTSTETLTGNTTKTVTLNLKGRSDIIYDFHQYVGAKRIQLVIGNTMRKQQNVRTHRVYVAAYQPGSPAETYQRNVPPCVAKCWLDPASGWNLVRTDQLRYGFPSYSEASDSISYINDVNPRANAAAYVVVVSDFEPTDSALPMTTAAGRTLNADEVFVSTLVHGGIHDRITTAYQATPVEINMFPEIR